MLMFFVNVMGHLFSDSNFIFFSFFLFLFIEVFYLHFFFLLELRMLIYLLFVCLVL